MEALGLGAIFRGWMDYFVIRHHGGWDWSEATDPFRGFPAMLFSQISAVQIGGFFLHIFVDIFVFSL
jgi:hypothetical protein